MGGIPGATDSLVPVIDISEYLNGDRIGTSIIAKQLRIACISPGFFQITGHNVSPDLQASLLSSLADFFALSSEVKQGIHRNQSRCLRGYEAVGDQKLEKAFSDQKEGFMVGPERDADARFLQGPNQWPNEANIPGFRAVYLSYFEAVRSLSVSMFRLMALSLDLGEKYFDDFVGSKDAISMCRAHRYPPTTPELAQKSRGIGAHTDFGALTLLLQDDIGGLEVYHRPTETWHSVTPVKNAYVVNIGDMMERWTNNMYSSTLHRVISPVSEKYRYSVAFFNEGLLDQQVQCISSSLRPGEQPVHEPIKVEDYLRARYGNSY